MQELYELFIKGIEKAYFDTPENISVFPGVVSVFEQLQKVTLLFLFLFLSLLSLSFYGYLLNLSL